MSNRQLRVSIDKTILKVSDFASKIEGLGFELQALKKESEAEALQKKSNRRALIGLGVAAASTGNIMLLSSANYAGATLEYAIKFDWLGFLLFLPILTYSAQPFWKSLISFAKARTINIDLTIITAIILGTTFSLANLFQGNGHVYFDSMAMLLLLLLSSRYFLNRIQQKFLNTNYLNPLLLETSILTWIPNLNRYEERSVKTLKPGDIIRVLKKQSLPADGKLLSSTVFLNTAVLTGEPKPQAFETPSPVYAGYQVLSDSVDVCVSSIGENTRIGKILNTLNQNLQNETPLTSQLNQVARIFTLAIIGLALSLLLFFSFSDFSEGVQRALALSILACPCALALAVPLTQSIGLINASKKGIIIKDGNALHELSKIENFVFDKTGTLTEGKFDLVDLQEITPLSAFDKSIIVQLEKRARHPIAKSIVQHFEETRCGAPHENINLESWKEVFGVGVQAHFKGDFYELRSAPEDKDCHEVFTRIGYYKNSELVAIFKFGDQILTGSTHIIEKLASQFRLYLVSGDNLQTVTHVAKQVGIDPQNVRARFSPEEKVNFIQNLPNTAMVGDGANDAAALAKANIGIAVKGSMAASLKAAKIYFTQQGVHQLLHLLSISQMFEKTVRSHLWFSAVYNIVGATAAILGFINPLTAALLMPASSLFVLSTTLYGMNKRQNTAKPIISQVSQS